MEYNTQTPLLDLAIKFPNEKSFDAGYTVLNGNAFKFDNYKALHTLRFFTKEQQDNAVLQLVAVGLEEGTTFTLADNF